MSWVGVTGFEGGLPLFQLSGRGLCPGLLFQGRKVGLLWLGLEGGPPLGCGRVLELEQVWAWEAPRARWSFAQGVVWRGRLGVQSWEAGLHWEYTGVLACRPASACSLGL